MNLDPNTFGKTPAALYLVDVLNEIGDVGFSRSISKRLTKIRQTCNELYIAQVDDCMSCETIGLITNLLKHEVLCTFDTDSLTTETQLEDLAVNLAKNICVGELKKLNRAIHYVRKLDRASIQRAGSYIQTNRVPPPIQTHSLSHFVDEVTPEVLQQRSLEKQRKRRVLKLAKEL